MTTLPNRRTTKPSPLPPLEPIQSTYDMHLSTLERRFGKAIMARGFSGAPLMVLELGPYKEIGMTRTEVHMWECIVSKQRDNKAPWLAVSTIADLMQCSERSVQRYIRRLEKKGLLIVHYKVLNINGTKTNTYDFTPLYDKCIALHEELAAQAEALRAALAAFMSRRNSPSEEISIASGKSQFHGDNTATKTAPQADVDGDRSNMHDSTVRQPGHTDTPFQTPRNSAEMTPSNYCNTANLEQQPSIQLSPNEESNKEDYKDGYDSRSRTPEMEAFDAYKNHDYTTSNIAPSPNGYTNRLDTTTKQSNDSYNDGDAETNDGQRNRNRDRTFASQSAGGAGNSSVNGTSDDKSAEAAQIIAFEEQQYIKNFMTDMSREMHDNEESYASNVSRLLNLYMVFSHLFEDAYRFGEVVQEARSTAMRVASVQRRNKKGKPNRVPYFFSVLEDRLTQMEQSFRLSIRS